MKVLALPAFALALAAAAPAPKAPAGPTLSFPLACQLGRTCAIQHYVDRDPGPGTRDYRCGLQTYEKHNGIDIRLLDMAAQRRGVNVLAAAAGTVTRLRDGEPDISIRAPGAPPVAGRECGNAVVIDHGAGWETQYCHLARGSLKVKQGDKVAVGAPIAHVGLSGATEFPHLHMTVRHAGQIVDPFAPDMRNPTACAAQAGLWTAQAKAQMTYRPGVLLNAGFTDAQITMNDVEDGRLRAPTSASPILIAYGRAIALLPGDSVEMDLRGPDGVSLAHNRAAPLQRWRAQDLSYMGKRRPATGWPPGIYVADYKVWRAGRVVISHRMQIRL
ncbi:MAG: M23 family metallopeptidase [Alphaproteobacteria bacterium]|nr:M23 family metallopeptidase [Alphaproteobacteria bacterium]MBU1514476.1 M23 family metallopeptidase [Alphaproteobacteria bacterium]MBU2096892.1 M23 family metallopeptidase [Alphaproteobacteria bacterium]MBU2153519.1 M23 family metallopeptidase [Alphaproteobacteria bacterium]MBU2305976.1 M23 family metallopeptidase [Alphaproteobacteria bacterium]